MATSHGQREGNGRPPVGPSRRAAPDHHEPIAVVGIGCRFPGGASEPEAFWRLLESGVDAITVVPADRWDVRAFHDPDPSRPGKTYSRWGGFVEGIDRFDPHFFGISPREAALMDPQQRLLLEVAWEGLEDAGLRLDAIAGSRTAVFVGISSFDYSVLGTSFRDRGEIDVYSNPGGSLSIAANRISYCFDLRARLFRTPFPSG
jgi:acyl transferase domain-containing protein